MRLGKYTVALSIISLTLSVGSSIPVIADPCTFLNRDPLELRDRQVFYRMINSSTWVSLDNGDPDLAGANVEYAYVIREGIDPDRKGVVVLKSARIRRPDETGEPALVRLVRRSTDWTDRSCSAISEFPDQDVSARSYDDFHDQGLAGPETKTLRSFHAKYPARLGRCRKSDDNSPDSLRPRDARSNRGQFSFDPEVVSQETYSQVLALGRVTNAYANTERLRDQRVEMRQYQVSANFPTCVRFTLPAQGKASFLRINDLEALTKATGGPGYVRSQESNWQLSR